MSVLYAVILSGWMSCDSANEVVTEDEDTMVL